MICWKVDIENEHKSGRVYKRESLQHSALPGVAVVAQGSLISTTALATIKMKDKILAANQEFIKQFGGRAELASSPAKKLAVLTCMDARMDPIKFAGLTDGDAHIIRNAGGRASDDAIRSLIISHKLLATNVWLVIQHTLCGMASITNEKLGELLTENIDTAVKENGEWKNIGTRSGNAIAKQIDWMTISNLEQSVRGDVKKIKNHPLVPDSVSVYGMIYDVNNGKLSEV